MPNANSLPSPAGKSRKKRRAIIGTAIAAGVLIIGLAGAFGSSNSPGNQPAGNLTTTSSSAPAAPVSTVAVPTVAPAAPAAPSVVPPPPVAPPTQAAPPPQVDTEADCGADSYINSDGQCVHDPEYAPSPPPGATARCKDGTYSFSKHHSGTCSGHHGVAEWLN